MKKVALQWAEMLLIEFWMQWINSWEFSHFPSKYIGFHLITVALKVWVATQTWVASRWFKSVKTTFCKIRIFTIYKQWFLFSHFRPCISASKDFPPWRLLEPRLAIASVILTICALCSVKYSHALKKLWKGNISFINHTEPMICSKLIAVTKYSVLQLVVCLLSE